MMMMIVVTDSEKTQPRLRLTVSIQQVLKILRSPMQSRVDQTLAASLPRWRQQPVTWAHKKQKRASVALATGRQFYSDFNRSSVRAAVKETLTKPQSNPAVIIRECCRRKASVWTGSCIDWKRNRMKCAAICETRIRKNHQTVAVYR